MSYVTYSVKEKEIVESGITSIQEILMGEDTNRKRSLLLCLDFYLDPYYGHCLSYEDEIVQLLQTILIIQNELDVWEDAIDLLSSYGMGPFPILEQHFAEIDSAIKEEVKYIINMHREEQVIQLVLEECKKAYNREKELALQCEVKYFPQELTVIYRNSLQAEIKNISKIKINTIEMMWTYQDGEYKSVGIPLCGLSRRRFKDEGRYYIKPEIQFNINLENRRVLLMEIFGPKEIRCLAYDLLLSDIETDQYILSQEQILWIS